ncbi:MAG: OmpA family protein [Pseudorhodobacter sp.]
MKRLLTSTTALSLAFAPMSSLPLAAQVAVDTPEGTAFCLAVEADPCPEGEVCFVAEAGDCAAEGIEAEAEEALLDTAAEVTASEAAAEAGAAPGETVSEAPAEPPLDAPVAEESAGEAVPDPAPEPPTEVLAAPEVSTPDAAASGEAAVDAPVDPAPVDGSAEVTSETPAEDAAPDAADIVEEVQPAETESVQDAEPAGAEPVQETDAAPAAAPEATVAPTDTATAETPAEQPAEIIGEAASVLQDILGLGDEESDGAAPTAAAAAGSNTDGTVAEGDAAAAVSETEITSENTRSSSEEFAAAPAATASGGGGRGLSDLERFGLVALGALAVGALLKNGDQVVSNSGDRVVVQDDQGQFRVLKDDDTLLRRPGSRLRTETFNDGSTRSTLDRDDGTSIVTIRDASGRVLRRARYAPDGTELVLIDDLQTFERIDVATLPPPPAPREQVVISAAQSPRDLSLALAAIEARENARAYSLRQIREYREVRALAPTIDVQSITFRTGSAAIDASEAEKLSALGRLILGVLQDRPYEIFLVEGHTDAVGSASSNLALSDRRAESVALALTEYFGIPPENLVVQGYGEAELRIPTQAAEERNRRAAVRLISPLLRTAASR